MSPDQDRADDAQKWTSAENTRWLKHGFGGRAIIKSDLIDAVVEQDEGDDVAQIELLELIRENEVPVLAVIETDDGKRVSLQVRLRPDQAEGLADALLEYAQGAREKAREH